MKFRKKRILQILVFGLILIGLIIHFYLPRFITEIRSPIADYLKEIPVVVSSLTEKTILFKSTDSLTLVAKLSKSKQDSAKATIILVHGIRGSKIAFDPIIEKLTNRGFNTVAVDLRAHGDSGGSHCTFGVKEKEDIRQLINVLEAEESLHASIGIWGQSLGGAVALQAMATDKRIKFGIVESTFAEFEQTVDDYFSHFAGFSLPWFTGYLTNRSGKIADFEIADASPIKICPSIEQPILLVHGDKDQRIDISYSEQNLNAIKSNQKEYLVVEGAGHLNVWKIGEEEYFNDVFSFIDNAMK